MNEMKLVCNYKECRKRLTSTATVTICSHVFCDEHAETHFTSGLGPVNCPICTTQITGANDILNVDLDPTDHYKAMILSGLRPEVVMDIASRALSFWNYQTQLEHAHQVAALKKYRQNIAQLEVSYEGVVAKVKADLTGLQMHIQNLTKENAEQTQKVKELSEKLTEKTRQCQKLQMLYENKKREITIPRMIDQTPSGQFGYNMRPKTLSGTQFGNIAPQHLTPLAQPMQPLQPTPTLQRMHPPVPTHPQYSLHTLVRSASASQMCHTPYSNPQECAQIHVNFPQHGPNHHSMPQQMCSTTDKPTHQQPPRPQSRIGYHRPQNSMAVPQRPMTPLERAQSANQRRSRMTPKQHYPDPREFIFRPVMPSSSQAERQ